MVAYVLATAAICELGLTASICFHVARRRVPPVDVVRTGAWAILVCGTVAGAGGYLLAPLILHGHADGELALRIAFAAEPMFFLGGAWASAVQATDIRSWNLVRLSQPVFYVLA
nr:hypothetical protein [Micromonospora sp. DSM 115978]